VPGKKDASLQNPAQYERLKEKGFPKESAARISNAKTPGHKVMREALKKDGYSDREAAHMMRTKGHRR
jgi:hypothetical protein